MYHTVIMDSSCGNALRPCRTFRSAECHDSMALGVYMARRRAGGESHRPVRRSQSASQLGLRAGDFASQRSAQCSSACAASDSVAAPEVARKARQPRPAARATGHPAGCCAPWAQYRAARGCGHTASMAAGSPLSPSTQAIQPAWSPRCCSAVKPESQHCAPARALRHHPRGQALQSPMLPEHVLRGGVVLQQCVSQRFLCGRHTGPLALLIVVIEDNR